MRVTCTNCGGAHTPWDCKRPAKKSTAALKEVQKLEGSTTSGDGTKKRSGDTGNARLGDGLSEASKLAEISQSGPAGTQALPVDTNTADAEKSENLTRGVTAGETAPIQKRPRGRPKSITDMAAYKRAKQREYRAKWKGRE